VPAPFHPRIRDFYIFRAVTSFSMWIPFWVLWLRENEFSYFEITLVDVGFWVTMIVLQIPAGLLSDRFGRKWMLLAGEFVYAAGLIAFGLSTSFVAFLIANVIWSVGATLITSADTPFLYDLLLELGREDAFTGIMGRAATITLMGNAAASLVGGYVASHFGIQWTLIVAGGIGGMGALTGLRFREPRVGRHVAEHYVAQLREGVRLVLVRRALFLLIAFELVLEVGVYVMAVFRQIYVEELIAPFVADAPELRYVLLGAVFAAFLIFSGFAARNAETFERRLGERRSLAALFAAAFLVYLVIFLLDHPSAIITQFIMYGILGLQSPIIYGYVNRRVGAGQRATILALANLTLVIGILGVEPIAGFLADAVGLRGSLLILGLASAVPAVVVLWAWTRNLDREAAEAAKAPAPRAAGPDVL